MFENKQYKDTPHALETGSDGQMGALETRSDAQMGALETGSDGRMGTSKTREKRNRLLGKGKERIRKEKLVKKRNAMEETSLIYVQVSEGGRKYETHISPKMALRKIWQKPNPEEIRAIIPGVVLSLSVQVGDAVEFNQELMVFETMKMHNVIRAPFSGKVVNICINQGDKLPKGALMMVIRSDEVTEDKPDPVPHDNLFDDFG